MCFRGSRTASSDGRGVLQPALTLFLSQLFLLFHPTLVPVLGGEFVEFSHCSLKLCNLRFSSTARCEVVYGVRTKVFLMNGGYVKYSY